MATQLQVHLTGTVDGQALDLRTAFDLEGGAVPAPPGEGAEPAGACLVAAGAALPALALHRGLARPVAGLPVHGRTRLDLLGDHGRDLGTAVVVSTTCPVDGQLECDATAREGRFALEISEQLRVQPAELTGRFSDAGCVFLASMHVSSSRGADYVVDAVTRLWNVAPPE